MFFASLWSGLLPALPGAAHGGTPFPCQSHRCGCPDAATCWSDCCCYTAAEKVAWARSWGVEPPPELIAQAELESATAADADLPPCCRRRAALARASAATPPCDPAPFALVRHCKGDVPLCYALAAMLPPPEPFQWSNEPLVSGDVLIRGVGPSAAPLAPDPPPPRV